MIRDLIEYFSANSCWPIMETTARQLMEIVTRHVDGVRLSAEEVEAATGGQAARNRQAAAVETDEPFELSGSTAIVEISGIIAKYSRMVNGTSQPRGTSVERLSASLEAALSDDRVRSILLRIESPGGSAGGIPDLGDAIWQAGQDKPVIAFADDLAASGAYWLGSQAGRFYGNQSAKIGSIGVFTLLVDSSRAAEQRGLRVHLIRSGEFKGSGAPGVEVSGREILAIQREVEAFFGLFLAAVLRGRGPRGLSGEDLQTVADGRMFVAADAVELGLIDGVMSFRQALTSARPAPRSGASVSMNLAAAGAAVSTDSEIDMRDKTQDAAAETVESPETAGAAETAQAAETTAAAETAVAAAAVEAAAAVDPETLRAEGARAERERIDAIVSALPGDLYTAIRKQMIEEGRSPVEAKAAAFDVAEGLRVEASRQLADYKRAVGRAGVSTGIEFDASDAETEDSALPESQRLAKQYSDRVAELVAGGQNRATATSQASEEFPAGHQAWIKLDNARRA